MKLNKYKFSLLLEYAKKIIIKKGYFIFLDKYQSHKNYCVFKKKIQHNIVYDTFIYYRQVHLVRLHAPPPNSNT